MSYLTDDKPQRLASLDAYRGFVMLAMASSGLSLAKVSQSSAVLDQYNGTSFESAWHGLWSLLGYHTEHVAWTGCSFWDLIQPSFMFMVGVAMPFSYSRRREQGQSGGRLFGHVLWRSFVLVLLGIFLSSNWNKETNFTFTNVLAQIGLGYWFVYLLLGRSFLVQSAAIAAILGGYWYLFYQHPLPSEGFDYASVGLPADWPLFSGLAAHWNKNVNFAAWFDAHWLGVGFMNLFPRPAPFVFNDGGYQTLNFVPSMATMIFGLMTGEFLRRSGEPGWKAMRMFVAGLCMLAAGMAVDGTIWPHFHFDWTLCPIVKRIWTPSWAVFSTGWALVMLSAFYWLIDAHYYRRWAFPFVVVGMNSIAMYVMAQLLKPWVAGTLKIHIARDLFDGAASLGNGTKPLYLPAYGPMVQSAAVLFVLWLVCLWMYRRKIFVKI
jgi:heparan-alpha-glucosaminide N-acetyltransferase